MAVWRVLLNLSVSLLPTNGVAGIDARGFDRSHVSKHYTKPAKLTLQQLKVTLLVDTRANAILNVHITTTRKHDTQIAPSLINRNPAEVDVFVADKGYNDQQIRAMPRENGIRPLIKHREFSPCRRRGTLSWILNSRPTESERNGELSNQAKIRCIRSLTTMEEYDKRANVVSESRPVRREFILMGVDQREKWLNFIEARSSGNRVLLRVPVNEACLCKLWQMDVVEFSFDRIRVSAISREFFGFEFSPSPWIVINQFQENQSPGTVAKSIEYSTERHPVW